LKSVLRLRQRSARVGLFCALALRASGDPAPVTEIEPNIRDRFMPVKPTAVLRYDASYRFAGIRIKRAATVTIRAVEGLWRAAETGLCIPACRVDCRFDTLEKPEDRDRRRLAIHNRILAVLAMPDLDTLRYVKYADEIVDPLFRGRRETRYRQAYDLEHGGIRFRHEDLLTGTVTTNLQDSAGLNMWGKDVARFLRVLSGVYRESRPSFYPEPDFYVHVNIDGHVRPFGVVLRFQDAPSRLSDGNFRALRLDVRTAGSDGAKKGRCVMWGAPFDAVARCFDSPGLHALADGSPDWYMVPMVIDYGLILGCLRCSLKDGDTCAGQFEEGTPGDEDEPDQRVVNQSFSR